MSLDLRIKPILLVIVAVVVLPLAINVGYGLLPSRRGEMWSNAPYVVLGFFLTAVSVVVGFRLAAGWPGVRPAAVGLAVGAGLAVLVVAAVWLPGRLDLWLLPNAAMAAVGGWLGGWLARRAGSQREIVERRVTAHPVTPESSPSSGEGELSGEQTEQLQRRLQ
ncbi:MAG: hypothetical protein JW900_10975 [Anaerolineae bacterium]|nr:hypothetical protein [Anaerolineae bacterium]